MFMELFTFISVAIITVVDKRRIPSTCSKQTVEKIEVIQVIVLSEVSKLNHSVLKKFVICHPTISCQLIDCIIK